jgi:hypothetical protein
VNLLWRRFEARVSEARQQRRDWRKDEVFVIILVIWLNLGVWRFSGWMILFSYCNMILVRIGKCDTLGIFLLCVRMIRYDYSWWNNDNVYIVWSALGKTVRFPCVIFPVPSAEFNSWNAFTATIGSSDKLTIVSKAANTWKNIVGKRLFKVSKRISKRSLPLCYSMIPEVIRTRDSVYSPNTSSVWLQESCTTTSSKRLVTKQAIRLYNLIGLINLLSLC